MKQIWKNIDGFSRYQVSNTGKIKALAVTVHRKNNVAAHLKQKILRGAKDGCGYLHVRLISDSGKIQLWKIHQVVGKVFLGYDRKNTEKMVIDHIDNNKTNNNVLNLQIVPERWNVLKGQHTKYIERRMRSQTYYILDYTLEINKLQGIRFFKHTLFDAQNNIVYEYQTSNRVLYEEAVSELKNAGMIQDEGEFR